METIRRDTVVVEMCFSVSLLLFKLVVLKIFSKYFLCRGYFDLVHIKAGDMPQFDLSKALL